MIRNENLDIIYDKHINGIPALLIEVLSPSNPETDLKIKRAACAQASVPEYWIVRPASRDVLVCSKPDPMLGDYLETQHVAPDATLASPTLPVRATVADFFTDAPDTML